MIALSEIKFIKEPPALFSLLPFPLKYGWNLAQNKNIPDLYLAKNSNYLYFGSVFKAPFNFKRDLKCGSYFEGLWENDVSELFFFKKDGSYLEFNLSPSASWWAMEFKSYRVRKDNYRQDFQAVCSSSQDKTEIKSLAALPLNLFKEKDGAFNLCAIVGENNRRTYLTYTLIKSRKPDFHLLAKRILV